jgi:tripartite-type tricarboxylate transporter receptor subunit TctC
MRSILFVIATIIALSTTAVAADQDRFYEGKTIQFLVGASAGGGYDRYARTIAKHLPRFIPGNPGIFVKNMQGAGGKLAAAYLANVAPRDGTMIGAILPGSLTDPLFNQKIRDKYDPTTFNYLGSANQSTIICLTGGKAGGKIKTLKEIPRAGSVFGASAPGGLTYTYSQILKSVLGVNVRIVPGYNGTDAIMLAIERGEVDGMCGFAWSSFKAGYPDAVQNNTFNILVQFGAPSGELTSLGVPSAEHLVTDESSGRIVNLLTADLSFGRPYVAPAGVPSDRVVILQHAFEEVFSDKQFLEDAKRARLEIQPLSGEGLRTLLVKLYQTPPDLIEQARAIICSGC